MLDIILASNSPRRLALLSSAVSGVRVIPSAAEEVFPDGGRNALARCCVQNADAKAKDVFEREGKNAFVLGADTLVALGEKTYGKPKDNAEAERFTRELLGKTHEVVTGVCLYYPGGRLAGYEKSLVTFQPFFPEVVYTYINSGRALDKAGAYGIQDLLGSLVKEVRGGLDNVMGLPIALTLKLIEKARAGGR